MQIDYALILGAGLGTRMGEIGKVIPKILWPVYFKTMLELQVKYCEDLGIKNIYLNTHFLNSEIQDFLVKNKLDERIKVLNEEILLDSGGAIHNFAIRPEVNYQGTLLLINADQFLFFDKKYWNEAIAKVESSRAVLFGIKVEKSSAYNEIVLEDNILKEIRANTEKRADYITYSGLGILSLKNLKPIPGISRFFETVVDYKNEKVEVVTPKECEYWDFGTAIIYANNTFKLKKENERESEMGKFLTKHLAFVGNEEKYINTKSQSIDLDAKGVFRQGHIHAKDIYQKI
ncbi:MAG: sugar phosphate nucleotidyltransferase [Bacteriovorax sp.]|nr:sugar phosphate nucleotidyltransferase [Bacteriovorax sp.]